MAPSSMGDPSGPPPVLSDSAAAASSPRRFGDAGTEGIPTPHFGVYEGSDPYSAAMAPAAAEESRQRHPLSAFSPPEQTESFRPVLEVDSFRWPTILEDLLVAHRALLLPVVEQLLAAREEGRSMVGIAGARPGAGCTTMQLCLARLLAESGKLVAIVDANFASAGLARQLGLEITAGWEDVLLGQVPLAECVVQSLEDRIALLPLAGRKDLPSDLLTNIQTSISAGVLRYHYDLVLFDLGAAGQEPQQSMAQSLVNHCRLDASIIVADASTDDAASSRQIDQLLSIFDSSCLGLIGNNAEAA